MAAPCSGAGISSRFTEATRLCSEGVPPARARAAESRAVATPVVAINPTLAVAPVAQVPSYEPVAVTPRDAVSIRMPGYRQRLAVASRAVRAQGGRAATPALVAAIAHRYRINPRLLASMMRAESGGNPVAVSHKGALGLMQVMPGTARRMGVRDPRAMLSNPVLAISTGAAYLKHLQGQFGNNVPLVVAAYNAGPGAVRKYRHRVPPYRETQGYVRKVMGGFASQSGR